MICLTGDIHHQSLRTGNQLASDVSETRLAVRAMKMARTCGVRLTYFLTGRLVMEAPDTCRQLASDPAVEIGGHNYWCFEPKLLHRVWNALTRDYAGPRWLQRLDIRLTIGAISDVLGREVRAWRNHMYMHGPLADELLLAAGIEVCSDGVDRTCGRPRRRESGLWELPINIIPDHEHLYHAERTPAWVRNWVRRYHWRDDFGSDSYFIDEWARKVIHGIHENERSGRDSVIIIHPITMYLCDGFAAYRRILETISRYHTVTVSELLARRRSHTQEKACA